MPYTTFDKDIVSADAAAGKTGVEGFPWVNAILGGAGLLGGIFGDNEEQKLKDQLFELSQYGIDIGKLAAPEVGAINKNFTEALTNRMKGLYSQGLGNTGAVEEVPLNFMESKNYSMGQAYNKANVQNENIKNNAKSILSGMNLNNNDIFGQLAGYGGYNVLKHLMG